MHPAKLGAFACVVALLASCGDSASDPAASTAEPSGSIAAGDTVTPASASTATVVESSPEAGSALPLVRSDISGEWVVLREVTIDGGAFGSDQYAELRQWDITCVDAECHDIDIAASIQGQQPDDKRSATFDAGHLSFVTERSSVPCFVVADNSYTGPPLLQYTEASQLDLTETDANGDPAVMRGTYTYDEVLDPAAAGSSCSPDPRRAEMDVLIFRIDRVTAIEPAVTAGVARGGANVISVTGPALPETAPLSRELGSQEYPIKPAVAKQFGDYDVVIPFGGSSKFSAYTSLPVSGEDPVDGYTATSAFTDDCVSPADGSVIAEGALDVENSVVLRVFDAGEPVVMIQIVRTVVPRANALVDPANCYAYTETTLFGGRIVPDPFSFTAEGEPIPSES